MNRRVLALTAAAVMLSGCSGSKLSHKGSDVPDRPETWSVEQRTLEDITPMTGEERVYVTRDEETDAVKIIQGVLSDDPINNEREALDLIASYSQVMGYIDVFSTAALRSIATSWITDSTSTATVCRRAMWNLWWTLTRATER